MTEMRNPPATATRPAKFDPEATGWVGGVLFAGVMLFLVAMFQGIAGITALVNDQYYVTPARNLVIHTNYTVWGWAHLALALVCILAGAGIFAGRTWARGFGIAVAFLGAVGNLLFLGASPVWGIILIAVDVLVIYSLAVHGREVQRLK